MKKFLYMAGALALMATVSCKDDDGEGTPSNANRFTYDGKGYDIKKGIILDFGAVAANDQGVNTHYLYSFGVTDGNLVTTGDEPQLSGATYALQTSLFSAGTAGFSAGTFEFVGPNGSDDDFDGKNVLVAAILMVDGNNDGDLDDDADQEYIATGGTVKVSGSGSSYSLMYDLKFGNKDLDGGFNGSFTIMDGQLDDDDDDDDNGDDDDDNNTLLIGGQAVEANAGVIVNFGVNEANTHLNYDFMVTDDANFTASSASVNGSYMLYSELFSAGSEDFSTGVYDFATQDEDVSARNFFNNVGLYVDTDEDGQITDNDGTIVATGGTVTLSIDNNDVITIAYDLEFEQGLTITGSYTGAFDYVDGSELIGGRSVHAYMPFKKK